VRDDIEVTVYCFMDDWLSMDDVYRRSYISMLFLYMNGMLTTPYEIRNIYAQEYCASSVRSVSVLDMLKRVNFVSVLWLFHAHRKVRVLERAFESFERKHGLQAFRGCCICFV
jgi:hypothetical protein